MPAAELKRQADVLAIDVVETGDRLGDDRDSRAMTGKLLQRLLDDGHRPELVELVEHDHDGPGLGFRVGEGGAHGGDEFAEEQPDQRRQRANVIGVDDDVDRHRALAEIGEGKVVAGRRAVDGRVVPERHARAAQDRGMGGKRAVGIACELAEGLGGVGVFHLLGMLAVNLLGGAPTKEDAADLADGGLAPLNGQKTCGHEEFAPLGQEVAGRALVGNRQEIVRDLGQFGVAPFEIFNAGDALERVVAMGRMFKIEGREAIDRVAFGLAGAGKWPRRSRPSHRGRRCCR